MLVSSSSQCLFSYSDEDMQSLASLMSLKYSDIGNMDDFNDSDEEDKRLSTGIGRSMAATGRDIPKSELNFSTPLL